MNQRPTVLRSISPCERKRVLRYEKRYKCVMTGEGILKFLEEFKDTIEKNAKKGRGDK